MSLNDDQLQALAYLNRGCNVFITGSAGTGKTHLIRFFIHDQHTYGKQIGITATTGAAALHIGGKTLHSFMAIGLAKKSAEALAMQTMTKNKRTAKKLRALDTLVIDEVSLMDAELFDKLSAYLQIIRDDVRPFGGVQLVLCGDFAQLPPVSGSYCFTSKVWKQANIKLAKLTTPMRQQDDTDFFSLLERARWGALTEKDMETLRSRVQATESFPDYIVPTRLYSVNADVDAINSQHLQDILDKGETMQQYEPKYEGGAEAQKERTRAWATSLGVPARLALCRGAQVVVTYNINQEDLVNGTRAVVEDLSPTSVIIKLKNGVRKVISPIVVSCDDDKSLRVTYLPLKLAWAVTIHRSQGLTLDAVQMDLGNRIFATGQAYTALSRAKTLESVSIISLSPNAFKADPLVLKFYGVSQ